MSSARLVLEFDPDSDPPTGTINMRSDGKEPFHGWIELTQGLELAFAESRRRAASARMITDDALPAGRSDGTPRVTIIAQDEETT